VAADGFTDRGPSGDNEGYDATTNTWSSLASDPTSRSAACAGGIGPRLYVAGGLDSGNLTESFNVSTNTWKKRASMPQAAQFTGSAVYKGQLYCLGGVDPQGAVLNNVQIYQP
jgi:hypothetical protein